MKIDITLQAVTRKKKVDPMLLFKIFLVIYEKNSVSKTNIKTPHKFLDYFKNLPFKSKITSYIHIHCQYNLGMYLNHKL